MAEPRQIDWAKTSALIGGGGVRIHQWRTLHEILGGGASARGLVRFLCPSHGRGIRGMLPQENFEIYNP